MKSSITFITLCLMCLTHLAFSQENEGTLYFHNGTILKGYAETVGRHQVRFKDKKDSKSKKIHFSLLKKVEIEDEKKITTYVYLPKKGKKESKIYKQLYEGNVSLYFWNTGGSNVGYNASAPGVSGGNRLVGSSFYIENYFIKRSSEHGLRLFCGSTMYVRGFKKAVKKFLNDCPTLVEKVKNKEIKQDQIIEAFDFYNKCIHDQSKNISSYDQE